tara:strand:- start:228 stop:443 length:216 start_codon:yes stop_codon:yes gene_type:complete
MKAKDFDIYKLFSDTFKGRKMFGFMDGQELSLLPKVDKPIRQTKGKATMGNHVEKFIKEKNLTLVVDNGKK